MGLRRVQLLRILSLAKGPPGPTSKAQTWGTARRQMMFLFFLTSLWNTERCYNLNGHDFINVMRDYYFFGKKISHLKSCISKLVTARKDAWQLTHRGSARVSNALGELREALGKNGGGCCRTLAGLYLGNAGNLYPRPFQPWNVRPCRCYSYSLKSCCCYAYHTHNPEQIRRAVRRENSI